MKKLIYNAKIYQHGSFIEGYVLFDDKILEVAGADSLDLSLYENTEKINANGKYLTPGLIDIHTHGRASCDFVTGDKEAIKRASESYLKSGVTTCLPTLASAKFERMCEAVDIINEVDTENGADFGGVHFEGRYLNPSKRGAHAPDLLSPLDASELDTLTRNVKGVIRISAAFELDKDHSFADKCKKLGASLSLAHSNATYKEAICAVHHGVSSFTHLYNAMSPLHHRDGGAVAAAFMSDTYAELICDGFHISPEMIKLAYKNIGKNIVLITDSMEATGSPDGEYSIAGQPVTVKNGKAMTHDGAIAGSTLSLFDGIKNYMSFAETDFPTAVMAATEAPADAVGLTDRGRLEVGERADMLIINDKFEIEQIYKLGLQK